MIIYFFCQINVIVNEPFNKKSSFGFDETTFKYRIFLGINSNQYKYEINQFK